MTDDPMWPRASDWLASGPSMVSVREPADLAVVGVPAHLTSISPTGADATPAAIRQALARFTTFSTQHRMDVRVLTIVDAGDIPDPDHAEGEARVIARVAEVASSARLLIALGGDNSITYPVACGVFGHQIRSAGLVTLDAHHDLRDGMSNGSPVRRLIEAGVAGVRVVQIGIADYANSADYSARARDYGITIVTRGVLRKRPIRDAMAEAMSIAGAAGGPVHVDIDVDVCDRSVAPGCPASLPGGISAEELLEAAFIAGQARPVRSVDITEIDASADSPDQRTVRLGALCLLEVACGRATRE